MKTLLVVISLFISISSFCQDYFGAASLGGNFGTFNYGDQVDALDDFSNSRDVGLSGELKLALPLAGQSVYLTPGVFYQVNGSEEYYSSFQQLQVDRDLSLSYIGLKIPLELGVFNEGQGFLINGSFFFDYAISGSLNDSNGTNESLQFRSATDRMDYGFSISCSLFQSNTMGIEFGYHQGLKNIEFAESAGIEYVNDDTQYLINNNGFVVRYTAYLAE